MAEPTRILILSASIGEGHDAPARALAAGILEREPGAQVEIVDTLALVGPTVRGAIGSGSQLHSAWGRRLFDLQYRMCGDGSRIQPNAARLLWLVAGRRLGRAVRGKRPDVVVATYPVASELLGELRRRGLLSAPAASAVTDLAALAYWAHPGIDLHLITHPESEAEVLTRAPGSAVAAVRGLTAAELYAPRDGGAARASLGLPGEGPIVAISGGGWAIGDLAGAAQTALDEPGVTVVCLCGRSAATLDALSSRFAREPRVTVLGFTDRMGDLLAAADVLVHSTAGLTVLEALMRGCRVISYGWGGAHIRVNNRAFQRLGLAEVALTRAELRGALRRCLASRAAPDLSYAELPEAAELVLALAG